MFYSDQIYRMCRDDVSFEEICSYFEDVITPERIKSIMDSFHKMDNPPKYYPEKGILIQKTPPKEGTISRMIYDKVTSRMTLEEFKYWYKPDQDRYHGNAKRIADELDVPYVNLRRFYQGYIKGRCNHAPNAFVKTKAHSYQEHREILGIQPAPGRAKKELEEMRNLF